MRRFFTVSGIILFCFILQSTICQALSFASIVPNLLIVVTSSFGFMRGKKEGLLIGLACGLLCDLFYGEYMAFYGLCYMTIGYLNGYFYKYFYSDDIYLPMFLISGSDLLLNFVYYTVFFLFRENFNFSFFMMHIIIPELVYTLLITILLYWIILKINQWLEKKEKRSLKNFGSIN